jgi:hypothetical protein
MRKRLDTGIKPSEITPEDTFMNRRTLLTAAVAPEPEGTPSV